MVIDAVPSVEMVLRQRRHRGLQLCCAIRAYTGRDEVIKWGCYGHADVTW